MELLKIGKTLSSSLVLMGMAVMVSPLPLLAADPLDVALPSNATITLKDGQEFSGVKLVEINNQTQIVKFTKSGVASTVGVKEIQAIAFTGNYEIRGGTTVVRGENLSGCSNQQMTIPVNDFKVAGAAQAQVDLSSLPTTKRKEISQTSKARGFVVNKLQFNGKGGIDIEAKACAIR
jgi:hypothetical protein